MVGLVVSASGAGRSLEGIGGDGDNLVEEMLALDAGGLGQAAPLLVGLDRGQGDPPLLDAVLLRDVDDLVRVVG